MWNNKKQQKVVSPYVKPTNLLSFKTSFQKVDQHAGGKLLFHGTKRRNDNQLQSLELPCTLLWKSNRNVFQNQIISRLLDINRLCLVCIERFTEEVKSS